MKYFGVYLHNYKIKKCILLEKFISKENALEYLTNYTYNYIIEHEGIRQEENFKLYREPSSLKSKTFNNYPNGYFICYTNESFYKNIIYLKEVIKGYLINSYNIQKIISLDIIEIPNNFIKENEIENESCLTIDTEVFGKYENVLEELINLFKEEK